MNITETKSDVIDYQTNGTCCKFMQVSIQDGKIKDAQFMGGCAGNLLGIQSLIKGMTIDEIISKFKGIKCGNKETSCPDQLATCLTQYKAKQNSKV